MSQSLALLTAAMTQKTPNPGGFLTAMKTPSLSRLQGQDPIHTAFLDIPCRILDLLRD